MRYIIRVVLSLPEYTWYYDQFAVMNHWYRSLLTYFLCAGIFLMLLVDVVFVPTCAPFVVTPYSLNIYISYYNKPSDHLKVLAPFGSDAHAPLRPTYSTMWFPFIHKKFGPSLKRQKYFRAIKFVDEPCRPGSRTCHENMTFRFTLLVEQGAISTHRVGLPLTLLHNFDG